MQLRKLQAARQILPPLRILFLQTEIIEETVKTMLMDITSFCTSAFQDERSRISLLPAAVKLTRGRVYNAGRLLQDVPTQAVLGYAGGCRIENVPGGEKGHSW
jgi:hypothetical protein